MAYKLASHVRACVDRDWLILLDLAHNRYLAADASLADVLAESDAPGSGTQHYGMLDDLCRRGLVEAAGTECNVPAAQPFKKSAATIAVPAPLQFLCAAHWARSIVRRGAMLEAVEALAFWKCGAIRDAEEPSTSLFARLRLWHPAKYVCLFDSLCLMRFLLARGERADLVVGVRARPFFAHAWVEAGGEIVDDGGEDCKSTREILRV